MYLAPSDPVLHPSFKSLLRSLTSVGKQEIGTVGIQHFHFEKSSWSLNILLLVCKVGKLLLTVHFHLKNVSVNAPLEEQAVNSSPSMEEQSYRMRTTKASDIDVVITGSQSMTNSLYQTKQLEDVKKG